jgi:hypothetical protein
MILPPVQGPQSAIHPALVTWQSIREILRFGPAGSSTVGDSYLSERIHE